MTEQELINQFGKEERYKGNYSDFIDQDQLARNDFFHYKKGYELGIKQLETTKRLLDEAVKLIDEMEEYLGSFNTKNSINTTSLFHVQMVEFLAKLSKEGEA